MKMRKMEIRKLKVGDVIKKGEIYRKITEVRQTGYSWHYVDEAEGFKNRASWDKDPYDYISENSNDQFLVWGWKVVETDHAALEGKEGER